MTEETKPRRLSLEMLGHITDVGSSTFAQVALDPARLNHVIGLGNNWIAQEEERSAKAKEARESLEAQVASLKAELELAWSDEHDPLVAENQTLREKVAALELRCSGLNKMSEAFVGEASRQRDEALAKVAAIEARIRELTERRPMETAPRDGTRILLRRAPEFSWGGPFVVARSFDGIDWSSPGLSEPKDYFVGWWPLPSTEGGDRG